MQISLPPLQFRRDTSYRNIYTCKEQQSLFDDLIDPKDIPLLQSWDNATSGIDHTKPKIMRVFQYGDISTTLQAFDRSQWRGGRFGDGLSYGVWYGALEEETSVIETLFRSFQNFRTDILASKEPVTVDRKMFKAECVSNRAVDLRGLEGSHPKLVDENNYDFCRELGAYAVKNQIGFFLTPSVRRAGGTCTPVFDAGVIKKEEFVYFFHFTFYGSKRAVITRDSDRSFDIPANWS